MISSIIDVVLLSALAGTTASVLLMYRRLQRFDALQGECAKEFARSSKALDNAREAIKSLQADGGDMAVVLAGRLNEARMVLNDIDQAMQRTLSSLQRQPDPAASTRPQQENGRQRAAPSPEPPATSACQSETPAPREATPTADKAAEKAPPAIPSAANDTAATSDGAQVMPVAATTAGTAASIAARLRAAARPAASRPLQAPDGRAAAQAPHPGLDEPASAAAKISASAFAAPPAQSTVAVPAAPSPARSSAASAARAQLALKNSSTPASLPWTPPKAIATTPDAPPPAWQSRAVTWNELAAAARRAG